MTQQTRTAVPGDPLLRVHHFLPVSYANGPGRRAVLWVQGCSLGCPGCFNPETHRNRGGEQVTIDELYNRFVKLADVIEGITISGGEPLQQFRPLLALLQRVRRETALSVLLFTGYTWDELQRMPQRHLLLSCIDILIAGRYDVARHLARDLRGSANKSVHMLSNRYTLPELETTPTAEVVIGADGTIHSTGIDPVRW